jgi:N-acetylglutamate synthase
MPDRAQVVALETLSFRAQPALETRHYDGWLLRLADGYTRRANSVNPIYGSTLPLSDKIVFCEAFYTDRHQPTIFRMTPFSQPAELDEALAAEGYVVQGVVSVRTMPLEDAPRPAIEADWVRRPAIHQAWLDQYIAFTGLAPELGPRITQVMEQLTPSACFLQMVRQREVIAVGRAVFDDGWLGMYNLAVNPRYRNQGIGRQMMLAMLAWGVQRGASDAYLQVETANTPAITLVDGLGFRESYAYWYRARPSAK